MGKGRLRERRKRRGEGKGGEPWTHDLAGDDAAAVADQLLKADACRALPRACDISRIPGDVEADRGVHAGCSSRGSARVARHARDGSDSQGGDGGRHVGQEIGVREGFSRRREGERNVGRGLGERKGSERRGRETGTHSRRGSTQRALLRSTPWRQ